MSLWDPLWGPFLGDRQGVKKQWTNLFGKYCPSLSLCGKGEASASLQGKDLLPHEGKVGAFSSLSRGKGLDFQRAGLPTP